MADDDKLIEEAQRRFQRADEFEHTARHNFREDMRFRNGDALNHYQWDQTIWNARNPAGGPAKPCLTINKTRQHCLQITNDALQNQMGIKVNAVGFGATAAAADGIEGIVRHIEYASNAQQNAYKVAFASCVDGGIGWWKVETDYAHDTTMDQDIFIRTVPNALDVWCDPDCEEPDKSDARFVFLGKDWLREDFEKAFPKFKNEASLQPLRGGETHRLDWSTKTHVRVMEYWWIEEEPDALHAVPGVGMMRRSDMSDELKDAAADNEWPSRDIAQRKVMWCQLAGEKVIDGPRETVWSHLPLVPVIAEETIIEGRVDRKGHTRCLIDAQRMYNYNRSAEVEYAAGLTRMQFMGDKRATEGLEAYWNSKNVKTFAFLPFNSVDDMGAPIPPPMPVEPPQSSEAFRTGAEAAANDMQLVSGQYQAEMGAPSNERSGVAITQRQRQGDTATYHFTDAMGAALRLTGKIIVSAIPKVYDTQRATMILAEDGQRQGVVIDPSLPTAHQTVPPPPGVQTPTGDTPEAILAINPTIGRYDVEADVGPAFGTRRQDAFNAYSQIMQAAPALVQRCGDLLFKVLDAPLADEFAKRLAPPGDDPAAAAAQQQVQALTAQLQQAQQALKDKGADLQAKMEDTKVKLFDAVTRRLSAIGNVDPAAMIPLIRDAIAQAYQTDLIPVAHPHDPSLGGPPPAPAPTPNIHMPPQSPGQAIRPDNAQVGAQL